MRANGVMCDNTRWADASTCESATAGVLEGDEQQKKLGSDCVARSATQPVLDDCRLEMLEADAARIVSPVTAQLAHWLLESYSFI